MKSVSQLIIRYWKARSGLAEVAYIYIYIYMGQVGLCVFLSKGTGMVSDLRVRRIKRVHLLPQIQLLNPPQQIPLHARARTKLSFWHLLAPKRPHEPKRRVPRLRRRRLLHPVLLHILWRAQNPEDIAHAVDGGAAIDLPAQEKDDVPAHVVQRRDVQQVPEGLAVLPVVQQQLDALAAAVDRDLDPLHALHVCMAALQEAAVARDDVGARVAGHFDEAVAREDDRVVGFGRVGQDEAVAQAGVAAAVRGQGFGGG